MKMLKDTIVFTQEQDISKISQIYYQFFPCKTVRGLSIGQIEGNESLAEFTT